MTAKKLRNTLRTMLNAGRIAPERAAYFAAGRCTSRYCGRRCGLVRGHTGEHTALSESDAPWVCWGEKP
jgi:hypothetical protein